jgi:hypothetical protein
MMLKTGMATCVQVSEIPPSEGSTVVEAEQKHIGRVEIEFCPSAQRTRGMRERLTADQAVHTLLVVVDTVKVGLPSVAASTSSMTVHTKPSIASDFRYPSIKLNISRAFIGMEGRLTRRTPCASFRNIAAPLPVSFDSTDV